MSDTGTSADETEFGQPADEIRVHSQDPAEGPDPDDRAEDQPRVHSQDATEG